MSSLDLSYNQIQDNSLLASLQNLSSLKLRNNQIQDISFLAGLQNLTNLDLSDNQIQDISFLADLKNLSWLILSSNQIQDYNFLAGLQNLSFLYLSDNQIQDISFLAGLQNLSSLYLRNNQIQDISFLAGLQNLSSLYLRNNQIQDYSFLAGLQNLSSLDLSDNQIQDISFLAGLQNLSSLYLRNNQIQDISFLAGLQNLSSLDLSDNQIQDISFLAGLQNLSSLYLRNNQIQDISFLAGLQNLSSLYLRNNQIQDYSFLAGLQNLSSLDLSDNQIQDYSFLADLQKLSSLDLRNNQIQDISFLAGLQNLTSLDLSDNQIQDISFLAGLQNLTYLYLGENQIQDISFLADLQKLTDLNLSDNQIQDISFLAGLQNLTYLYLGENQIQDISILAGLQNLIDLDLSENQIQEKPILKSIASLRNLSELVLMGNNSISVPHSIIESDDCLFDLRNYFQAEEKGKTDNKSLKMILIGNGCVGKTTLAKRLIENPNEFIHIDPKNRTHGIVIQDWELKDAEISVQVWDFGGQEVFHPTHRLFLSPRTLYILVWAVETIENAQETDYKPEYWLDYVADLGPRSRVIVAQNMMDLHGVQGLKDMGGLIQYYQNETDKLKFGSFLSISAATGQGREALLGVIKDNLRETITEHHETIPTSWFYVREQIEKKIEHGKEKITYSEMIDLCKKVDLEGSACHTLIRFLHDTGVLFYQKNLFNNEIILDQQWAVNAVYEALRSRRINQRMWYNKYFTFEDAREVWPDQNDDEIRVYLGFMTSCEIAFVKKVGDEERYSLPQLLPNYELNRAKNWMANNQVMHCRLQYPYLHRAIIERFIVKTAALITEADQELWRDAIGIYDDQTESQALITTEKEKNEIHIRTWGREKGIMLAKIKTVFDDIRSFKNRVELAYSWNGQNWISEEDLRGKIKQNEEVIFDANHARHQVSEYQIFLHELKDEKEGKIIRLTDMRKESQEEELKRPLFTQVKHEMTEVSPRRIFISYSHQNRASIDQLLLHLSPLKRRQKILTWSDTDLLPSEEWDYKIKEELARADIILLLVSPSFLGSDYIWEVEIQKAVERHALGKAKVIPIALDYCDWEGMPFAGLHGPIKPEEPILSYDNQNKAWLQVVAGIKEVVKAM